MDRWKWKSSTSIGPAPSPVPSPMPPHDAPTQTADGKAPRVLTRALRTLSSSSMDSMTTTSVRSSNSTRKLHKTPSSNSSSMLDRLQRRVSKDSALSERPGSPIDQLQPYALMDVIHCGPLKTDVSLLKARSEYLVLSDQVLVKFGGGDAARAAFPQLNKTDSQIQDGAQHPQSTSRLSPGDVRIEILLRSVVAAFNDDGVNNRSGIEIWWFSPWPRLAYCKAHFYFSTPNERDIWLASIHRASRPKLRATASSTLIPDNLRSRIDHIVRANEGHTDATHQNVVFPVARRVFGGTQKTAGAEEAPDNSDISSFFLVIGPCMCHFVEVLKADHATLPGDLRVKAVSYGTVTLTRFRASVASHEHRFVMCFRSPFGRETRIDLASAQYRRVIETLTKVDRNLKPMWPQHFQQVIFDVKGLPPPLQLTSGNDLGGVKRSLEAYCAAYQVQMPNWTIEWSPPPQPAFRLLPPDGQAYSSMQLLAVFRALRYNSFFKAISFRDVDLSALGDKNENSQYGDSVAYKSLNGLMISEEHHEMLLQAPTIEQEIHALLFASEATRSIDLTNVSGQQTKSRRMSRLQSDLSHAHKMCSEVMRPMLMLLRRQLCVCHSIAMSGNPIPAGDLDELANILVLDHVHMKKLDFSKCSLGDTGLSKLWMSLAGQCDSLEWLDTSDNHGVVRFETVQSTLSGMRRLTKLKIAGNTRITSRESLLDEETIQGWGLQEIDLSGIMLNEATVNVLCHYLGTLNSNGLRTMRLNNCGLTGRQLAQIFVALGPARPVAVHINASRMDDGIDDLCAAIADGFAPWCLLAQMVEFAVESNYIKLLRALTANNTIEYLSLAGTSTPDTASSSACQAISDFFSNNRSVRFLDFSGFDSKLDEGRLGREFSKALLGLRTNNHIEHLRVRSQMLNINIGDLAEAISENKVLRTLDCEGNDFNLSNFTHLVTCLEQNTSIRYFSALSDRELDASFQKSMETASTAAPVRRSSVMSRFKSDKAANAAGKNLVQKLRDEWNSIVASKQRILERNRASSEQETADPEEPRSESAYRSSEADALFANLFGGFALEELERQRAEGARSSQDSHQAFPTEFGAKRHTQCGSRELGVRRSSTVSSDTAGSPSSDETSTASGEMPTPPDIGSPIEQDFVLAMGYQTASIYDDQRDGNYTYTDGYDVDDGLQMKRYRRYLGDPTSRIDEEEVSTVDEEESA